MNQNTIKESFQTILNSYNQARNSESFAGHQLRSKFENVKMALAPLLAATVDSRLKVKWSKGQGNWAKVPWIAILDERETDTTQRGIYCVYLFRQDMSGLYLTLNQGVTHLINDKGKAEAYNSLRARVQEVRPHCANLASQGFKLDEAINLKADPGLGADYEPSTIAHKFSESGNIPNDKDLAADLEALVNVYEAYLNTSPAFAEAPLDASMSLTGLASEFVSSANYSNASLKGVEPIAIRFISAALSKRFIIFTGLAGSGKTKLAQAFARWITSSQGNGSCPNKNYKLIPVGADWIGSENILGYPNGLDKETYVSRPALDLVIHAQGSPYTPHFLILDEMNLSHVERYFADILSVIESEEMIELYDGAERRANGCVIPARIELPKNLFIIGTVNVDETTYMFSPKVLDRANVIEFRMEAAELGSFLSNPTKPDLSQLDGKGMSFARAFVEASKSQVDVPADVKPAYEAEMLLLFKALQAHGAEFGYRTAHEAARFIHFYKLLANHLDGDTGWFIKAFDCVIFQKLLPKLHGSRSKLGPLLKVLWFLCVNDASGRGPDALKAAETASRSADKTAEPSAEVPADAPYPLSAEKIGRMWRLLRENGFTSFTEA
jgi:5-methylcytosine-specific restriction protein B